MTYFYEIRIDLNWVQGSGFKVQGSGFRVRGSGFGVRGSGLWWRLRRLFLEDGILVSQPSPLGNAIKLRKSLVT